MISKKNMYFYDSPKKIMIALGIVIVIALYLSSLIVFAGLVMLSMLFSVLVNKIYIRSIGIEFILLATIFSGVMYGSAAGAIVGFILITFHLIVAQYTGPYIAWVIPEYLLAGFLAGQYSAIQISSLGLYLVLFINVIGMLFTFAFSRDNVGEYLPYTITNIIFNFLIFKFFAPALF